MVSCALFLNLYWLRVLSFIVCFFVASCYAFLVYVARVLCLLFIVHCVCWFVVRSERWPCLLCCVLVCLGCVVACAVVARCVLCWLVPRSVVCVYGLRVERGARLCCEGYVFCLCVELLPVGVVRCTLLVRVV